MRRSAKMVLLKLFLVIFLLTSGCIAYWYYVPLSTDRDKIMLEIQDGETYNEIVKQLHAKNLIRWPILFELYGRMRNVDRHIKSGSYELEKNVLPEQLINKLLKGMVKLAEFSHPPGYNFWQVAERLEATFPSISKKEWLLAFSDPFYVHDIAPEATSLEGFLFPDVYKIKFNPKLNEVIAMMTNNFKKNLTADVIERGKKIGLSPYKIIILASIIEKETGVAEERPLISAVFHTRLKIGMRLQTDPTVIYGIWEKFDGNLHKRDLEAPNQYNTYLISGLPPGPICNPGADAIRAAVEPANANFLYFVAKGDGTHYFSRSLEEHNQAVRKYQLKLKNIKGKL